MPFPLLTDRLLIRPLAAGDGADLQRVFAAPDVMRYWNRAPPRDVAGADEWALHFADMQRRCGYAQWHVRERASGSLAGIARHANRASIRVLQKLGRRALGAAEHWGSDWDKYELSAAEWRAAQGAPL